MSRYIITETEEEKQFLVKNMFSLKLNKKTNLLEIITESGQVVISSYLQRDRDLRFITKDGDIIFLKRNFYYKKIQFKFLFFTIYYSCFDALKEWLKDKQDSGYIIL